MYACVYVCEVCHYAKLVMRHLGATSPKDLYQLYDNWHLTTHYVGV